MKIFAMKRAVFAVLLGAMVLPGCARGVTKQVEAETLVERARMTVSVFKTSNDNPMARFKAMLSTAQGVAVFPALYKAGFVIGGEGGNGVLLARQPGGGWSDPAFYTLASGSVGLQMGGQISETILVLRSQEAVQALVKHQAKLGADLSLAMGTVGAGMEGSTTTNAGADVVVFSRAAGAFGGLSVEGGVMAKRPDLNAAYYGAGATPEGIVLMGASTNTHAAGLKAALRDN